MWAVEKLTQAALDKVTGALPESTERFARWCLLDALGAAAAGYQSSSATALRTTTLEQFRDGRSRVWFTPESLSTAGAALANSVAVSTLDIDDGHRASSGHPGAAIIPAVLAIGDDVDASGDDLLRAIVLGYEVAVRVGAARDYSRPGWLSTGRWAAYGVAAAAGILRGVDAGTIAEAISIASAHTPVLYAAGPIPRGPAVKEGIPWATLAGITAVDLASRGFTGPIHSLDYSEDFDADRVLAGLQQNDFAVESVYLKPYACCRWIHGAIDLIAELMDEHDLTTDDIETVDVYTFEKSLRMNNRPDPGALEDAQFSFPFSMALAAIRGRDALIPMSVDSLTDDEVIAFARRFNVHLDQELNAMFPAKSPARVSLDTSKGTFEKTVIHPLGDAANQMTYEQLVHKFRQATRHALVTSQQEDIIAGAADVANLSARQLTARLGAPMPVRA